jgi:hypothetical protein
VDALNGQPDIAQTIIDGGGDDVFTLRANHAQLHQAVVDWFDWAAFATSTTPFIKPSRAGMVAWKFVNVTPCLTLRRSRP